MTFPSAKVLDYAGREAELEADSNPFAKVVLAHLKALQTRRDPEERRAWKFRLVRGLYDRGFNAEDVRQLFRLIDWLMELPPALDNHFWDEVQSYGEERTMPFITTPERIGIKKGILQAIETALRVRFGEGSLRLMPQIQGLDYAEQMTALLETILKADSLEEVRRACAELAAPAPAPRKKTARGKRQKS
jgi:hypothetical protein